MTTAKTPPASRPTLKKMLTDLRLLVESLDGRVRQPGRPAEAQIASDAADLRQRAVSLIREIEDQIESSGPASERHATVD